MSFAARQRGGTGTRAVVGAGLALFVAWSVAPVLWLALSSFLKQEALISQPPDLAPASFTLDNFVQVLDAAAALAHGIVNSAIVAVFSTSVALAVGAPAAYALARLPVPRANSIAFLVLATQMLPGIAIAIPLFIAISRMGLIDSVFSLGFVYLSFNLPIVVWILRGFFIGIPAGIEKAAAIDGAGVVATFWHIVLPISIPPLLAAAVFAFIEAWNEFFFALILTRQQAQTVPLVIAQFAGQYQTVFGQMMAAAAISVAPVIALAIVFRNQVIRGFAEGMTKG